MERSRSKRCARGGCICFGRGRKRTGEWALIRTRMEAGKPQWLLLKTGKSVRALSKKRDDESAATDRTMKQIAVARDAEWQSNRAEKKLPGAKARFIAPMKPRLVEKPPAEGDWIYELKFDGIRLIAVKDGAKVNLISRNENELRARFPEVAKAIAALPVEDCVIDGEVVALDDEGALVVSIAAAARDGGREAGGLLLRLRFAADGWEQPARAADRGTQSAAEGNVRGSGRSRFVTPARSAATRASSCAK